MSSIHASSIDFPSGNAKWVIFCRSSRFSCGLITLYFLYSLSHLALVLSRGLMRALSSGPMQIMIKYRTFAEPALYFSLFSVFHLCFSGSTLRSLIPLVRSSTGSDVVDGVVAGVHCLITVYSNSVWSITKSRSRWIVCRLVLRVSSCRVLCSSSETPTIAYRPAVPRQAYRLQWAINQHVQCDYQPKAEPGLITC